jgi:hypothetical protein
MFGCFNQMQIASFSVQLRLFPQKPLYFHKNIPLNPCCIHRNFEYLSTQRRSNPPEGESRQEPRRTGNGTRKRAGKGTPGEPEAEPAREPGKELRMRIGNEVRRRTGNGTRKSIGDGARKGTGEETRKGVRNEAHAALRKLAAANGTRKLLRRNVMTEYGKRRAPLVRPE